MEKERRAPRMQTRKRKVHTKQERISGKKIIGETVVLEENYILEKKLVTSRTK